MSKSSVFQETPQNSADNLMSNIVKFPGTKQTPDRSIKGIAVAEPRNGKEYLDICKQFLEEEDYKDILCGIMDKQYYDDLEKELKKIVNCYYAFEL